MCKEVCKECKCKRETPQEIVTGVSTVVDINDFVDYDDIKYSELIPSTTSPRNLLNRGETSEQH